MNDRIIKFRGKALNDDFDKAFNKGDWLYGSLLQTKESIFIFDKFRDSYDKVDPKTVGQFIGLPDKNKVDIYEGDIVKYKYITGWCEDESEKRIRVVEYENGEFCPIPKEYECDDSWYSEKWFDFEVIGNKSDNPESRPKETI